MKTKCQTDNEVMAMDIIGALGIGAICRMWRAEWRDFKDGKTIRDYLFRISPKGTESILVLANPFDYDGNEIAVPTFADKSRQWNVTAEWLCQKDDFIAAIMAAKLKGEL